MQIFFISCNLLCYFVVHMSEFNDNDDQLESEAEIKTDNTLKINQKDLIDVIVIKHK